MGRGDEVGKVSEFLKFSEIPASGVTKKWEVLTKDGFMILGCVSWFPAWRRYAFYPSPNKLFDAACMNDISMFLRDETANRKLERKLEKDVVMNGVQEFQVTRTRPKQSGG